MRGDFGEGILAEEPRLDLHAGKAVLIGRESRDFLVGEARAQRQALEILGLFEQALETLAVARLHVDNRGQCIDRLVEILHPRRSDFERIGRIALRQHDAIAICHHAAVGNDGYDGDAVAFRERLVVPVLDQLEIDETGEKPAECDDHQRARNQQPAPEKMLLELRVPQLGRAERTRTASLGEESAHRSSPIAQPSAAVAGATAARP